MIIYNYQQSKNTGKKMKKIATIVKKMDELIVEDSQIDIEHIIKMGKTLENISENNYFLGSQISKAVNNELWYGKGKIVNEHTEFSVTLDTSISSKTFNYCYVTLDNMEYHINKLCMDVRYYQTYNQHEIKRMFDNAIALVNDLSSTVHLLKMLLFLPTSKVHTLIET